MTEASFSSEASPPLPEEAPAGLRTKRWRWWIHLVIIGAYPLLGVVLHSRRVAGGPALSGSVRGLLLVCGQEIMLFSVVFGLGWLASQASREELLFRWRPGWWVVPLGIVYSATIRFALFVVVMMVAALLLTTHASTPARLQEIVSRNRPNVQAIVSVSALRNDRSYYWLTVTLVSFVVAGLREEMWRAGTLAALRALWPGAFASRGGQYLAVTLIAALFGAMHMSMGPIAAVGAGLIGWLLGVTMIVHKSIWPAVIAHGLFDATTMAILPWVLGKVQDLQ